MQQSWMAKQNAPGIFISATERKNIDELRKKLMEMVKQIHFVRYPNNVSS
jgi:GTP-binding protein HflX